jgi:type I restriction enzyme S subunit
MKSGWKEVRLGDIIETNVESYSSKDKWEFANYLDTSHITIGTIDSIQKFDLSKESLPSRAKRKVRSNDIVYSTVRPDQKHYGFLDQPVPNMLVSTGFTVIRAKEGICPKFVYYFLTQKTIVNYLQALAEQAVSTYPSIKASDIE